MLAPNLNKINEQYDYIRGDAQATEPLKIMTPASVTPD